MGSSPLQSHDAALMRQRLAGAAPFGDVDPAIGVEAALDLALWTGVSLVYVAIGALSFALAIRPVRALAEGVGLAVSRWAALFFFLQAIGVYLGRIVRARRVDLRLQHGEAALDDAIRRVVRRAPGPRLPAASASRPGSGSTCWGSRWRRPGCNSPRAGSRGGPR